MHGRRNVSTGARRPLAGLGGLEPPQGELLRPVETGRRLPVPPAEGGDLFSEPARFPVRENTGMDIAFATHGARVAEATGDSIDDLVRGEGEFPPGTGRLEGGEPQERLNRASPCAEVLRGERSACGRANVGVHVVRGDVAPLACVVDILEELLAGQILRSLDDPGDAAIRHLQSPFLARLALESEPQGRAFDRDVPVAERRDPEAAVVASIGRIAHPDHRDVEKARHGREHLVPSQAAPAEVGVDPPAQAGQGAGELDQVGVLHLVAAGGPPLVVAVLLAAARVLAGHLQVAVRARGDPDVGPRRRDDESPDPVQDGGIADPLAVGPEVAEAFSCAPPPDASLAVVCVDQRHLGRRGFPLI